MRVLIAHSGNLYGGLEKALETFAREACTSRIVDLEFALCFDGPVALALREIGVSPTIVGGLRLTRPHQLWQTRKRFAEAVARLTPDVVVTTSPWSHVVFAPVVRSAGVPLLLWLHDIITSASVLGYLSGRHQPDMLIADSHFCAGEARKVFPGVPMRTVYYAVHYQDALRSRSAVRREFGVDDETRIVINVARLEPWKGHELLIDALTRVRTDTKWVCWFLGGAQRPEERAYLDRLTQHVAAAGLSERVHFLGYRQDVADLLGASDLYCHPNVAAEPFGLAVVEALYAGLPVVATDLGGPREILADGSGQLVPPNNPQAMATAIAPWLETSHGDTQAVESRRCRALTLCNPTARLRDFADALESARMLVTA
ncbi:MAG: glycosyltransferase [Vicinamibacterales bacterium]